ncbi:MAG TPA: hypothetical protein VFJ85_16650 [Acidimicrobiales bacterium]|nr:hypothetical protein [Acidimicrobiales bacterium]
MTAGALRSRSGGRAAVAAGLAVLVVGMASAAWACTPAASEVRVTPASGPPGTEATVTGKYFTPTVEIRWGSATGPVLARVAGSDFSAPVRIPAGEPGYYSLVAVGLDTDGSIAGQSAGTFHLTGDAASAETSPAPAGVDSSPAGVAAVSPPAAATATADAQTGGITSPAGVPRNAAKDQAAVVASSTARTRTAAAAAAAPPPPGPHLITDTPAGPAPFGAPAAAAAPAPAPVAASAPVPAVEPLKPAWQRSPAEQPVGLLSDVPSSHGSPAGPVVALSLVGVSGLFGGGFAFLTMARRRRLARSTQR